MNYSGYELLWLFFVYSFLGWIIETAVASGKNRKFINRGVFTGPVCFAYGFSAVFMTLAFWDLKDNPVFLFLGCMIVATAVEWFTGKVLERMKHRKWWDYSGKKWNFDGYICLSYSLLWGILGTFCLYYGNEYFTILYKLLPGLLAKILVWVIFGVEALDAVVSYAALFHNQKKMPEKVQDFDRELRRWTKRLEEWVCAHMETRIEKAGVTALLYKDRQRSDGQLFVAGTFLGGAYEYICSVFTQLVFGKVFWDYSKLPFNLGGRINLLFCFFWGIAAVVWIKLLYPKISAIIEKMPQIIGKIVTWILVAFMAVNMLVSAMALIRYDSRGNGRAARYKWEKVMDENFDDARMEKTYPSAKKR